MSPSCRWLLALRHHRRTSPRCRGALPTTAAAPRAALRAQRAGPPGPGAKRGGRPGCAGQHHLLPRGRAALLLQRLQDCGLQNCLLPLTLWMVSLPSSPWPGCAGKPWGLCSRHPFPKPLWRVRHRTQSEDEEACWLGHEDRGPWPLHWSEGLLAFASFPRETTGDPRTSVSLDLDLQPKPS